VANRDLSRCKIRRSRDDLEAANGKLIATFLLYGTSALDGSELWTQCFVTFDGFNPIDIRFGRNNAVVPPGLTAGLMKQLLEDMQRRANETKAVANSQTWTITDKCTDRQGIFVRLFEPTEKLAWPNWKHHYHIERGGTRTLTITIKPGERICYGARPDRDKSKFWGVGLDNSRRCDDCCYHATDPVVQVDLGCK
jgi:hypothetical protein